MKYLSLWSSGAVLCVNLVSGLTHAQPAPPPPSEIGAIARSHYELGNRYYSIQRFAEAAREFQEAYDITRRAELLFNIGRAHEDAALAEQDPVRREEHNRQALTGYQSFLSQGSPGVERETLLSRITELRRRLNAQPAPPTPRSLPARVEAPVPLNPGVTPPHGRSYALPITLFATGAAALTVSVFTGLWVQSIHTDLTMQCTHNDCEASLAALSSRGRTLATVTDVLLGVGALSAVAGALTLLLWPRNPNAVAMSPGVACSTHGCAASLGFRF